MHNFIHKVVSTSSEYSAEARDRKGMTILILRTDVIVAIHLLFKCLYSDWCMLISSEFLFPVTAKWNASSRPRNIRILVVLNINLGFISTSINTRVAVFICTQKLNKPIEGLKTTLFICFTLSASFEDVVKRTGCRPVAAECTRSRGPLKTGAVNCGTNHKQAFQLAQVPQFVV